MVFPSATAAALAAMSMQEELRLSQPGKGEDRLAMRIILTVGDVLHQEGRPFRRRSCLGDAHREHHPTRRDLCIGCGLASHA